MVMADLDILAAADDQETLEPVAPQPAQLALEARSVRGQATVDQIVDGLSFDGELVLQSFDRVIAGKERPGNSLEPGELERRLFAAVDRNHRPAIC